MYRLPHWSSERTIRLPQATPGKQEKRKESSYQTNEDGIKFGIPNDTPLLESRIAARSEY